MNAVLNKIVSVIVVGFLMLSVNTALQAKEHSGVMDKFELTKVTENTWAVLGPLAEPSPENQGFMNNPAFIIADKSVIVIDPGSSVHVGKALLEKIRSKTDLPITHVFNSHVHGDHWLANHAIKEAYPDVKIYAHPEMIAEAEAGEGQVWIDRMMTLTEGATEGTKITIPTIALEDKQVVTIDNITIKSHLNELAHTKTDAMFEIAEEKLLITGDNAFNSRMPRMDDGSYVGNMKAMDFGLTLDIETVIPGHGPIGGKEILKNYRDFLYIVYDNSKTLLDEDLEDFEMKPIIMEKLEEYKAWTNFEGAIGKLISVAVLEAESE